MSRHAKRVISYWCHHRWLVFAAAAWVLVHMGLFPFNGGNLEHSLHTRWPGMGDTQQPHLLGNPRSANPAKRPLRIVYGIFSIVHLRPFRDTHRQTWHTFADVCVPKEGWNGGTARPCSIVPLFVLGKPRNEEEELLIAEENAMYGDLVVLNEPENMDNGKSLAWWQHAAVAFPNATHVAKGDMDTFVWPAELAQRVALLPPERLYYGRTNTFSICGCKKLCPRDYTYKSGQMILLSTDLVRWVGSSTNTLLAHTKLGYEDLQTGKWLALAPFPVTQVLSKHLPFEHPLKNPSMFFQRMGSPRAFKQSNTTRTLSIRVSRKTQPRVVLGIPIYPDEQGQLVLEMTMGQGAWTNRTDICAYKKGMQYDPACRVTFVPIWCKQLGSAKAYPYEFMEVDCLTSLDAMFGWWERAVREFPWATHFGRSEFETYLEPRLLLSQLADLPSARLYYGRMADQQCGSNSLHMSPHLYVLTSDLANEIALNMKKSGQNSDVAGQSDTFVYRFIQSDSKYLLHINLARKGLAQPWMRL